MTKEILWENDLVGGLESARNQNKLVLIDFNGPS